MARTRLSFRKSEVELWPPRQDEWHGKSDAKRQGLEQGPWFLIIGRDASGTTRYVVASVMGKFEASLRDGHGNRQSKGYLVPHRDNINDKGNFCPQINAI